MFIFAAAVVAYFPCLHGGFIWDDGLLVSQSEMVKAPDGLYRFWLTTEPVDYWPVTNSSFWIEWRLWGMNPTGYHVTNLLLHIADSLLIWMVLKKLRIPGAFLAGLLFAVHPVNVESVAWIAQRKNVLSLFFFLLSMWWYLKAEVGAGQASALPVEPLERDPRSQPGGGAFSGWYWLSVMSFLLAMLSKGSVAILPLVLLLVAWWQRNRIGWPDLVRTAPFFVIAAVLTLVNIWFQGRFVDEAYRAPGLLERVLGAGAVVWFYLYKAVWPLNLVFVYPQWDIQPDQLRWWLPLVAAVLVTAGLWWQRKKTWARAMLFGWAFFCLALLPVMGFTMVGFMKYSLVADHYEHIALIGVAAVLAAAWSSWLPARIRARWGAVAGAAAVVSMLTMLTWQQSSLYASPITLYLATLEKNPDCWVVHNNLGSVLHDAGEAGALEQYQRALKLNPNYSDAHNNLAVVFNEAGRRQEAIEQFREALKAQPGYAEAEKNLGSALADAGQTRESIEHLQKALDLKPNWAAEIHCTMGSALEKAGQLQQAIDHFQQAIEAKPAFAVPYNNLAWLLATSPDEKFHDAGRAVELAKKAAELDPKLPGAFNTLGIANYRAGNWQEAIRWLDESVKSGGGGSAFDWFFLAMANRQLDHQAEAQADYEKAVDWMEKHAPQNEELLRFRREAEKLLTGKPASEAGDTIRQPRQGPSQ